jgi:aminoglycoside 6'-N-acetyltransferase I
MRNEFVVRPAHQRDVQGWAAMRASLWPDESPDELAAEAKAFFAAPDARLHGVLVAEAPDGTLIGFAELSLRPYAEDCTTSPVAFLEGWYVIPEARRRGVGRALLNAAENWGRRQGCREFASDTQLENTQSAAAHYALGFEDAGALRCFRQAI